MPRQVSNLNSSESKSDVLPITPRGIGGDSGIRTHGTLRYDSFQDCRFQPLTHASDKNF